MDYETFDPIITRMSRRYAKSPSEIEDLEQDARLFVWELLSKDIPQNIGYVIVSLENFFRGKYTYDNRQKRMPEGGIISIHQEIGEDLTIEDRLFTEDEIVFDSDMIEALKQGLVSEYGRNWVKGVLSTPKPRITARKIVRGAIEELAGLSPKEIPEVVDFQWFRSVGLDSMLWAIYRNSPVTAVMDAYKDEFVPWEFKRAPNGFWHGKKGLENAIAATQWLADKYGIKSEKDCRKIGSSEFREEGLAAMLQIRYGHSTYLALRGIFPDLKPWNLRHTTPKFFESEENQRIGILDFLISNGVGDISTMSTEEIHDTQFRSVVNKEALGKHGLRSLIKEYNGSTYRMFSTLFPEVRPWSLKGAKEPWKERPYETAAEAVKWLFDVYLGVPTASIPRIAKNKLFWSVGFSGIMTSRRLGFNSSNFAAVDNAYPGMFSQSDFVR